jgi:LacI family transcriptional regulator
MASPPLSSVALNTERVGYLAAQLLERMMRGQRRPARDIFIEPLGIVTRQSSDIVAIEDEMVAAALRYIRENACSGIRIADVLEAVPLSRSKLERDFRELLGRSPNAEIRRVQLGRVRQLLVDTDLGLTAIAARTGFSRAEYLCAVFKEKFGQTPGQFRTAARG